MIGTSEFDHVPSTIPRVATARLVGHDGPIQTIRFTGMSFSFLLFVSMGMTAKCFTYSERLMFGMPHFLSVLLACSKLGDGKYCLSGGHDRTVRLWNPFRLDPAFPRLPPPNPKDERVSSGPVFTATSYSSSSSSSTMIHPENLPHALPIQTYSGGITHPVSAVTSVESNTGQQLLLTASNQTLVVTDLVTNQVLRRLQGQHIGRINALAAANRGEAYLSASYDGTVAIWDGRSSRDTKPIQVLREAKDSVTDVHVVQNSFIGGPSHDPAMGWIRTASVDGVVRHYDLRMGVLKSDDCESAITSMAPTHDGQCLAISCLDGTIRLMELDTGELLNTYQGSHKAGQYGLEVAILANDATIATGSEDASCVLYDLVRATRVQTLHHAMEFARTTTILTPPPTLPTSPVCSIAAHPKQSSVTITCSYDEHAIVWAHDASPWTNQMLGE